jgi:COP9 signalosome complex subunit 1
MMHCPSIAPEAFQLCVQHIHQSRDPSLYQNLLGAYEQLANNTDLNLPNMMELAELDVKWADETLAKNQADRVKLEVELKTYTNNMIKESIRVCFFLVDFLKKGDIKHPSFLDGSSGPWRLLSCHW